MAKNLVIVESPAKAATIEKYLGSDFKVLASVGHIRKDTKVDKNTFDVTYEIDPEHKNIIADLKKAAKEADKIWLATDEDREGEAISWHLCQVLHLPEDTARITFHEITKSALENAIAAPRTVDMHMVSSQQARQTLDMLVGFDLSGVVRKKVPGAVSAGRVQSPALRLIVEREQAIEKHASKSTFKVSGDFGFSTNLDHDFESKEEAQDFLNKLINYDFKVADVKTADAAKKPQPPFTTATMQIEANSRLGFTTRTTMTAAQSLYQAGLITYHRTDSLNLSKQALASMASYVESNFGKKYVKVRNFHTKSAGAQEAHEAIRPTDITRETAGKNDYERRLYALIRGRALASQMADAQVAKTIIQITTPSEYIFKGEGEVITFDGFLKVYGRLKENELPAYTAGDSIKAETITARQTFSKPPARYTEGSLVKKLEELGIGRPSTYASIMTAIQARGYVVRGESEGEEREVELLTLESNQISSTVTTEKYGANKGKLMPTPIGELIAGFLVDNFKNIVDYKFTANIEKDLDLIAEAKLERVKMLRDFYGPFNDAVLASEGIERYNNARVLGHDPETGKTIYAKVGKNGGFIQLGENEKETGEKPRFAPLPARKSVKTVTLEQALKQLALPQLPRTLGRASDGAEIIAASGPFGPYLKGGKYNIPIKGLDPYTITLEEAVPLYEAKRDSFIADWGDVQIIIGAYGPYIKGPAIKKAGTKGPGKRNNVKIPADMDPKSITEEQARGMLANKPKTTRRPAKRRATAKKTTTKKTTTKKAAEAKPKKALPKLKKASKKAAEEYKFK